MIFPTEYSVNIGCSHSEISKILNILQKMKIGKNCKYFRWVLQCLDNVGQDSQCSNPPCAIVPLGTGTDIHTYIT